MFFYWVPKQIEFKFHKNQGRFIKYLLRRSVRIVTSLKKTVNKRS